MTPTTATLRDHALPARYAVASGVTATLSVGALTLPVLGHGTAAWLLLVAGILVSTASHLHWRRHVDGRPLGTSLGATAVMVGVVALLGASAVLARAVVVTMPAVAVLVALAAGAATAALLHWWQRRPVRVV